MTRYPHNAYKFTNLFLPRLNVPPLENNIEFEERILYLMLLYRDSIPVFIAFRNKNPMDICAMDSFEQNNGYGIRVKQSFAIDMTSILCDNCESCANLFSANLFSANLSSVRWIKSMVFNTFIGDVHFTPLNSKHHIL